MMMTYKPEASGWGGGVVEKIQTYFSLPWVKRNPKYS